MLSFGSEADHTVVTSPALRCGVPNLSDRAPCEPLVESAMPWFLACVLFNVKDATQPF